MTRLAPIKLNGYNFLQPRWVDWIILPNTETNGYQ